MENVTLTPKEQTRLQVLNSLLAEHIALDQAAELMGVSTRHTKRILAAYQERGAAALAMVTATVDRPTLFPRSRRRGGPPSHPQRLHLIPSQTNRVTFLPAT